MRIIDAGIVENALFSGGIWQVGCVPLVAGATFGRRITEAPATDADAHEKLFILANDLRDLSAGMLTGIDLRHRAGKGDSKSAAPRTTFFMNASWLLTFKQRTQSDSIEISGHCVAPLAGEAFFRSRESQVADAPRANRAIIVKRDGMNRG
ncbi:MAG: hypothetical protein AAAC50_23900 [Rhizobium altiplani]|uniref:hypothetical protein n=1 Tax=Rhizobium altiplani TaxID=1864509 RepID=UPI0013AFC0ED